MATATDIITYIGVPLAVLGVLPILYTFALSILTQRRIRHLLLSHGHRPHRGMTRSTNQEGFMIRASPMTSLIEVEMPRYTIAPVDRQDERYWDVDQQGTYTGHQGLLGHGPHFHAGGEGHLVGRIESTLSMLEEGRVRGFLRGGSWRTFHWRRLVVGRKLYRIQYEDELREPPAEIEFAELVDFLMDWGAELDGVGWEKLRVGGLWTPAATVLLRVGAEHEAEEEAEGKDNVCGSASSSRGRSRNGDHGDWVLRTSMPDDSDGILTLCVRWPTGRAYGSARNAASLPPGWGKLRAPALATETSENKEGLVSTISSLSQPSKHLHTLPSFRFKLESNLISTVHLESSNSTPTRTTLSLTSLSSHPTGQIWFTAVTASLLTLTKSSGSLWNHTLPSQLTAFLHKDSIPTGILVLLDLLDSSRAPPWDSSVEATSLDTPMATLHHQRFQARLAAARLEKTMPAEQARVHKLNREAEERRAMLDLSTKNLARERAKADRRINDAIVSPRVGIPFVADCALEHLIANGVVDESATLETVAEQVLYLVVVQAHTQPDGNDTDNDSTSSVLGVLEAWTDWSVAGGMKREEYEMLARRKREFCYAACLVAVVLKAFGVAKEGGSGSGKAGVDMLECLRLWRKVRLG